MIAASDKNLALNLQLLDSAPHFSPDDLVSYLFATDNMVDEGQKIKEINHAIGPSQSLLLKAKYVEVSGANDEESDSEGIDDMLAQVALFTKNLKFRRRRSSTGPSEKKRNCYNFDESDHFADKCPYKKRLDKPKYEEGAKPRLKPNPINERYKRNKKRDGKGFLGQEYLSDVESEDEEKVVRVAGLEFAEPGSLFTYDYTKDYADHSITPKVTGTCLMARSTKVISSPPSLSSILDDHVSTNDSDDDEFDENYVQEMYKIMKSLPINACARFKQLMSLVNSRDEAIDSLESHIDDEKLRFNLLEQELSKQRDITSLLKERIEIYELDKAKDMDTIDRAITLSQELDTSKKELEVAHASLTNDLDNLEKANLLVKRELIKLGENHDQLRVSYEKALGTLKDPIIVEDITCASNPSLDQSSILMENKKLKEQLEVERLKPTTMGKILDEILARQMMSAPSQGMGYDPKNDKSGSNPPKRINFVHEGHKVVDKVKKNIVNGGATRGNPNHKFAGKSNLSYVLCKGTQGDVYAKYVVPCNGYAYRWYSIWVPKDLVANAREPITQWVPKPKN
uniref:Uncharacterized protein n=1 Tax=Avena sativa TaxID=4498 RepID=A0ACD5Y5H7_AVESA